jgi:hypothetical protein
MHLKINIIKKTQKFQVKKYTIIMKRLSQDSDESQHSTYVNFKIFFWVNKQI